jgi:hypothetical protein
VADKKTEEIICTEFFNGKAHDGTVFKTTPSILERILVLADSGYRGVQKVHSNTRFPLRHKEDFRLMTDREQKACNKRISSLRMKAEHIIGRRKRFGIARERYRNRRKRFGLRYNLICGTVNYENRVLK